MDPVLMVMMWLVLVVVGIVAAVIIRKIYLEKTEAKKDPNLEWNNLSEQQARAWVKFKKDRVERAAREEDK